jgi:hypothetical protein
LLYKCLAFVARHTVDVDRLGGFLGGQTLCLWVWARDFVVDVFEINKVFIVVGTRDRRVAASRVLLLARGERFLWSAVRIGTVGVLDKSLCVLTG